MTPLLGSAVLNSVGMVLGEPVRSSLGGSIGILGGAPVVYTLRCSIGMIIGLILGNYFGTWVRSLVGVSFGILRVTLMGAPLGLWFRFEMNRYLSYYLHLTDKNIYCYYHRTTYWGECIYC